MQAIPNSVILTPCLRKDKTVVASSGTRFPMATTIPVKSQLSPYRFDIFKRAGIRNFSEIRARLIRIYIEKRISKQKKTLLFYNTKNFFSISE